MEIDRPKARAQRERIKLLLIAEKSDDKSALSRIADQQTSVENLRKIMRGEADYKLLIRLVSNPKASEETLEKVTRNISNLHENYAPETADGYRTYIGMLNKVIHQIQTSMNANPATKELARRMFKHFTPKHMTRTGFRMQ